MTKHNTVHTSMITHTSLAGSLCVSLLAAVSGLHVDPRPSHGTQPRAAAAASHTPPTPTHKLALREASELSGCYLLGEGALHADGEPTEVFLCSSPSDDAEVACEPQRGLTMNGAPVWACAPSPLGDPSRAFGM